MKNLWKGTVEIMAHLQCQTRIQIPNPMATLYYVEHVHIAQTRARIPTPYFCVG